MKSLKLIVLMLLITCVAQSQVLDYDAMYKSYLDYKVKDWGVPLNKVVKRTDLTLAQKLDVTHYIYGYIAFCIMEKDEKEARYFMSKMNDYLEEMESRNYQLALVNVYRSALAVYEISFSKLKAISNGKKCMDYMSKALSLSPNNPFVISYQGNVYFYMPSMFGGDKKRSIEYFNRALALYGTQMQKRYNWNVLETQLTLAQCYEKTGQVDKAIALCEQVLKSEPNYVYMRDVYLPQLKSSYNK